MKKKKTKKEQLRETAEELFLKYGPKRVSVDEICKKADVSKMTFYKYFSSKEEIVKIIKEEILGTEWRKFDEIDQMDIPFSEKIILMGKMKMQLFSKADDEMFQELCTIDEINEEFDKKTLEVIKRGQARGDLRQDIEPELIGLIREKMIELANEGEWKKYYDDYSEVFQQQLFLLFNGIIPKNNGGDF